MAGCTEDLAMEKELSEMMLEELWDLFPIFLVQHDDQWNEYYKEIEAGNEIYKYINRSIGYVEKVNMYGL